ncbi:MAG: VPLPA-CTERM sorting domain-containing protein [Nitrospirota bacterium]|nr:VPLPA-CTERM sorting domain-containing protein [Nitrospirota bacterium]
MNRWMVRSAAALLGAVGVFLSAGQASAHVSYGNSLFSDSSLIDPVRPLLAGDVPQYGTGIVNATPDRTVSSNAGWLAGQDATTWGNSHDNRFLYFNLAQASTIDFTITGTNTNGNGVLNPGYSIFQGVAINSVHDGAINPASYIGAQTGFASWSPFASANSAITNNGGTLTTQHWGQYRSNGDFTMANDGSAATANNAARPPAAFTLAYTGLFGANGTGNTITGHYDLGPGIYSLVVGGANSADLAALLEAAQATNGDYTTPSAALTAYNNARLARTFNIAFSVNPVPIPAAVWLFGSGLAGIVALARRRSAS